MGFSGSYSPKSYQGYQRIQTPYSILKNDKNEKATAQYFDQPQSNNVSMINAKMPVSVSIYV